MCQYLCRGPGFGSGPRAAELDSLPGRPILSDRSTVRRSLHLNLKLSLEHIALGQLAWAYAYGQPTGLAYLAKYAAGRIIMMPSMNKYAISFMAADFAVVVQLMQDHIPPSSLLPPNIRHVNMCILHPLLWNS
eukprot:scaffold7374_cov65-Skeletonema_dohrnii-CCMP3373.AAC.2